MINNCLVEKVRSGLWTLEDDGGDEIKLLRLCGNDCASPIVIGLVMNALENLSILNYCILYHHHLAPKIFSSTCSGLIHEDRVRMKLDNHIPTMLPIPPKKTKAQSKRSTRTETPPQDAPHLPELDPSQVCPSGDLVLAVQRSSVTTDHEKKESDHVYLYRVDSKRLREASPYFARLLDPDKFGEGARVAEQHAVLPSKYPNRAAVPMSDLPQVHIADLGTISPAVRSIQNLMADFLRALHNQDLSVKLPPLSNVANLAVVADRFDALAALRTYFHSRKLLAALDSARASAAANKSTNKPSAESEERVRQKLLVGLLLDNPSWVWSSSLRLIHKGWVGHRIHESTTTAAPALWWDLPQSIEAELLFRRTAILETIQSLQSHFLTLYTSRARQCKLGYDSSPECDLYQLGQMVKFFASKINTLSLAGSISSPFATTQQDESAGEEVEEEDMAYAGDIFDLLDSFRKIPAYQVDRNHAHCGPRTRLLPLLDMLATALTQDVGICLQCWTESRNAYAWTRVKPPLVWTHGQPGSGAVGGKGGGGMAARYTDAQKKHLDRHADASAVWLAGERVWTQEEEGTRGIGWSHPSLPYRS